MSNHMTRAEHFTEAERLIASTRPWADSMFSDERKLTGRAPMALTVETDYALRLAQIHATLASAPNADLDLDDIPDPEE
jgi:hypothetical protein